MPGTVEAGFGEEEKHLSECVAVGRYTVGLKLFRSDCCLTLSLILLQLPCASFIRAVRAGLNWINACCGLAAPGLPCGVGPCASLFVC